MFASVISRLLAPLLRACAYMKAFALLEERATPPAARYDVAAARGGAARTEHRPHQPQQPAFDDTAHGLRRHHGPVPPERIPARRPGMVPAAPQPCLTPVAGGVRRSRRESHGA
jgi:hypothetical protein